MPPCEVWAVPVACLVVGSGTARLLVGSGRPASAAGCGRRGEWLSDAGVGEPVDDLVLGLAGPREETAGLVSEGTEDAFAAVFQAGQLLSGAVNDGVQVAGPG